jgi:salicylate hydroxylase
MLSRQADHDPLLVYSLASPPARTEIDPLDVAIIGAGPGSLAAALALARQCRRVGVFERAGALRPIGAAVGLADRGYQALASIDPALRVRVREEATNPQRQLLMRPSGEVLFADVSPLAGTDFTWLGWYELQTALLEALPQNVELLLGKDLSGFELAGPDEPLTLHFHDQAPRRSLLLIGADGYRSVVRAQTVGDGEPLDTGTMTWRGRVSAEALAPLEDPFDSGAGVQLVVGEEKNFWIMQAGPHHIAWGGIALTPLLSPGVGAQAHALETFANWPEICQCCIHATAQEAIVESGVFDRLPVHSWGDGKRVSLLGDAAHPIRPSLGLGTTLAFEDAVALAASLEGATWRTLRQSLWP